MQNCRPFNSIKNENNLTTKYSKKVNNNLLYYTMKNSIYIIALSAFFLLNSCDKQTPSTVSGGGRIKFDISISPPFKAGDNAAFQFLGNAAFINVSGGNYSGEITPEFAVTKGQNLTQRTLVYDLTNYICRTITIKAILNGTVFDTKVLEMGKLSMSLNCKDGVEKSLNYIIP